MKLFALLAVLFFAFRAFSQSFNYFYIDDYIRAQEDKDYIQYLQEKEESARNFRKGVQDYKDEKYYEEQMQEQARLDYSEWKKSQKVQTFEKEEAQYEKQKLVEEKQFLALQEQYAYDKSMTKQETPNYWNRNSRMIASFEERKFIPKKDRKFKFKNKRR